MDFIFGAESQNQEFSRQLLLQYLNGNMMNLRGYHEMDVNRMTCIYFLYTSMNLLKSPNCIFEKEQVKEWVYRQLLPDQSGFVGGPYLGRPLDYKAAQAHLASTYTALCLLIQCGDYTFEKIDKAKMLESLQLHQAESGCMMSLPLSSEQDVRFCYCAAAVSYMLRKALNKSDNKEYGFNREKLISFITERCIGYQGGFTFASNPESHSGLSYCALATLKMVDYQMDPIMKQHLVEFLVLRQQEGGFQGRCNKLLDSCYSFWNKASLKMLDALDLVDNEADFQFVQECFTKMGGFSKFNFNKDRPDILHTFYSLGAIALGQVHEEVAEIEPQLAIPLSDYNKFIDANQIL